MGNSSYSTSDRFSRSMSSGYTTKSANDIFTQNKLRMSHAEMNPSGVTIRESRDSDEHPMSIPIIVALDVTGSMGRIPHDLVKVGLPNMMGGIIEHGIPDPQILFLGIGDHVYDTSPLQISQFESGDAELDMWLTRTYIESGGGGNGGESYGLAHYFAANHTVTDHWEKRGQKGFLFTIGDEPNLPSYPSSAMKTIMGNGDIATFTDKEILAKAQEQWNVFHIMPGVETRGARAYWRETLGDNFIFVDSMNDVASAIRDTVIKFAPKTNTPNVVTTTDVDTTSGTSSHVNIVL
jgi:hypothetical protein